jgi:hypothetical protein
LSRNGRACATRFTPLGVYPHPKVDFQKFLAPRVGGDS